MNEEDKKAIFISQLAIAMAVGLLLGLCIGGMIGKMECGIQKSMAVYFNQR